MANNPFTYGNPITEPRRFFGREREIEQVFSRLRNAEFESSSLVGERRVGKTSLLNYIRNPEVRRYYGVNPDKTLFVYVDLQMIDKDTTPLKLWMHMLRQMSRACADAEVKKTIEDIRKEEALDNFALSDLFDFIDGRDQYVVFLLDEFENVTENQNFDTDFFYGLRSLAIHHNLALITSSRRELIELCHSEAIRSSPFFNIFANINVALFSDAEARKLIESSLKDTGLRFDETQIQMIFLTAGYHPYFLQAACHFMFEAHAKQMEPIRLAQFMVKEFRDEAGPHLADYWHNSDEHEKIVLTVLALLERRGKAGEQSFNLSDLREYYARSDQTLSHLEKRGLVMAQQDGYTLFSVTFGDWIADEITDVPNDAQSYDEWLNSNQSTLDKLSSAAKTEIGEVLPKISSKYRDLIVGWVSDPKNLLTAAALLKGVLLPH